MINGMAVRQESRKLWQYLASISGISRQTSGTRLPVSFSFPFTVLRPIYTSVSFVIAGGSSGPGRWYFVRLAELFSLSVK